MRLIQELNNPIRIMILGIAMFVILGSFYSMCDISSEKNDSCRQFEAATFWIPWAIIAIGAAKFICSHRCGNEEKQNENNLPPEARYLKRNF